MKKIIGILMIGLLSFLGCGDSDDATTTVGTATPVAPFCIIETPTPTYEWTPISGATRYRLTVQDTNQESTTKNTQETSIIDEWYTAEESGCASEDGLCMVTPDIEVIGKNEFRVLACANQECGLWSEPLPFDSTTMAAPRFKDNGDGTVTDMKTELMWPKNANIMYLMWGDIKEACKDEFHLANYLDWRAPTLSECKSLMDTSQRNPALPPDNPFTNVQDVYWTGTTVDGYNQEWAYVMVLETGIISFQYKLNDNCVWPVRSIN